MKIDEMLVKINEIRNFSFLDHINNTSLGVKIAMVLNFMFLVFSAIKCPAFLSLPLTVVVVFAVFIAKDMIINQLKSLSKVSNYILIDTNILYDSRFVDVFTNPLFKDRFLIPKFVLQELKTLSESKQSIVAHRAKEALKTIEYMTDNDIYIPILNIERDQNKEVDIQLIETAQNLNAFLFTNDAGLQERALKKNVHSSSLTDLTESFEEPYGIGEVFEIEIVKKGQNKNEGVGYMRDGTMVVLEKGGELIGSKVVVEISRVVKTTHGRLFFADLMSD